MIARVSWDGFLSTITLKRENYFKRSLAGSGDCSSLEEVAHCLELLASCVSVFWVGKGDLWH